MSSDELQWVLMGSDDFLWEYLFIRTHINPLEPIRTHRLRCAFSENNNQYISDKVGKCNRLDKCGYHYTPREYFSDNPWLRDKDFYIHTEHRGLYVCKIENPAPPAPPKPAGLLPRWLMEQSLAKECNYKVWFRVIFFCRLWNKYDPPCVYSAI